MRKLSLIVGLSVLCHLATSQQQRAVQSLYMFDQLLINPAYAGSQVQLSATTIYRNQWVNLEGAPETFTSSIQSSLLRDKVGVGLVMMKDAIGVHSDIGVFASYAYKINFPDKDKGSLSLGLQAGFNSINSDFTKTTVPTLAANGAAGSSDPFFRSTRAFNPNFGGGIFYANKLVFAGFSVPYLLDKDIIQTATGDTDILGERIKSSRNYFISLGKTFPLSPDFKVVGSTLVRLQDGAPLSFDINANFVLKESVGLGTSYRLDNGVVFLFELKVNDNFHVGYAYDLTTSDLGRVSNGTHELMLNYRIKIQRWHKEIECPSYF